MRLLLVRTQAVKDQTSCSSEGIDLFFLFVQVQNGRIEIIFLFCFSLMNIIVRTVLRRLLID